jgi:2,4-dienoyl-CoA reductase-like NADH-dependent reductase (Old Yellow Enzyme family)/thioredoxin reductase
MLKRYANLTSPLKIRHKSLKTRLLYPVAQPHFLQANELYPADPVVSFYTGRAKNGAAILLMQDLTNLDQRRMGGGDIGHFCMYDLNDKGCQNGFTQFAEYIHYYGSYVCPELNLDNRMPLCVNDPSLSAPGAKVSDLNTMVPFDIDELPEWFEPPEEGVSGLPGRPMANSKMFTPETMEEYIRATVKHARTYQSLNYDGGLYDLIEYNFTIGKFLSPAYNWRTDQFGGSFENRIRFPVMVIKRLREAVGNDFILIINSPSIGDGNMSVEETAALFKIIEPYIDVIHLRRRHADHEKYTRCESAEYSAKLKQLGVKTPIAISTYYKDLDHLEEIIASGKADMIAPGHLFICNEHLGDILRDGNGEDLNPCIECHICRGSSSNGDWMSHCTINPEIGMEHRAYRMIKPVTRLKRIAVIGGGPGGMKCAMWLKERGHTPVIFEKTESLGGQIKTARYPDFKWELCRYLDFLVNQMERKKVEVHLNSEATPEMIKLEGFDVVIAAVGATPRIPDIEGAGSAKWNGVNIYGNEDKIGQKVVVVGGASAAAEAAIYLATLGKDVTEISRQSRIAYDLNPIRVTGYMNHKARQEGVTLITKAKTTGITPHVVIYVDKKGIEQTVECDDVVITGGMEPNRDIAISFASSAPEFYTVGDCRQPGNMRNAIRDAYAVAMQI